MAALPFLVFADLLEPGEAVMLKHHLGNLTIMAASDNSVIGNASFAVKKAEFARSGVGLTRRLDSFATS